MEPEKTSTVLPLLVGTPLDQLAAAFQLVSEPAPVHVEMVWPLATAGSRAQRATTVGRRGMKLMAIPVGEDRTRQLRHSTARRGPPRRRYVLIDTICCTQRRRLFLPESAHATCREPHRQLPRRPRLAGALPQLGAEVLRGIRWRDLYPAPRSRVEAVHGRPFDEYVLGCAPTFPWGAASSSPWGRWRSRSRGAIVTTSSTSPWRSHRRQSSCGSEAMAGSMAGSILRNATAETPGTAAT